jgi:hypothetical protein
VQKRNNHFKLLCEARNDYPKKIGQKKNVAIKRKISSTFKHSSLYGAFGNEILNLTNANSGKQLNIFDFMST